ncbi:MAG: hypothetical protein RTU92_02815 [Candidatus Thorarchaeota archaeon]
MRTRNISMVSLLLVLLIGTSQYTYLPGNISTQVLLEDTGESLSTDYELYNESTFTTFLETGEFWEMAGEIPSGSFFTIDTRITQDPPTDTYIKFMVLDEANYTLFTEDSSYTGLVEEVVMDINRTVTVPYDSHWHAIILNPDYLFQTAIVYGSAQIYARVIPTSLLPTTTETVTTPPITEPTSHYTYEGDYLVDAVIPIDLYLANDGTFDSEYHSIRFNLTEDTLISYTITVQGDIDVYFYAYLDLWNSMVNDTGDDFTKADVSIRDDTYSDFWVTHRSDRWSMVFSVDSWFRDPVTVTGEVKIKHPSGVPNLEDDWGLHWGVDEGDKIYYDYNEYQKYRDVEYTLESQFYLEVDDVPEVPSFRDFTEFYFTRPSYSLYYMNGTPISYFPLGRVFFILVGNMTYFRDSISDYGNELIEYADSIGGRMESSSSFFNISYTEYVLYSKSDGLNLYSLYELRNTTTSEIIERWELIRQGFILPSDSQPFDTSLILIGGGGVIATVAIVLYIKRRR